MMILKKIKSFSFYFFLIFIIFSAALYKKDSASFITAKELSSSWLVMLTTFTGSFFLSVFGLLLYPIVLLILFKNFLSYKNIILLCLVLLLLLPVVAAFDTSGNWQFATYAGIIGFVLINNINLSNYAILKTNIALSILLILNIFRILTWKRVKKCFRLLVKKAIHFLALVRQECFGLRAKNQSQKTQNLICPQSEVIDIEQEDQGAIIKKRQTQQEVILKSQDKKNIAVHHTTNDKLNLAQNETEENKCTQKQEIPKTGFFGKILSKKSIEQTKNNSNLIPSLDFLSSKKEVVQQLDQHVHKSKLLEKVLADFKIQGKVIEISVGPVVTLYELQPAAGIKSSTIISLATDVARTMSAISARISVIPGQNALGIELPNPKREIVLLRELLEQEEYKDQDIKLPIALGKSINGAPVVVDLVKMPHLLIAGTTGSGKSVAINAMLLSLLYRLTPEECRLILIDPKMLELSVYDDIPHLLCPVVIDPKKAVVALKWVVKEMERRYKLMAKLSVRNIDGYNKKARQFIAEGKEFEYQEMCGFDSVTGQKLTETKSIKLETMSFIVVVVDEMADLMLVAGKEIETSIQRLAQMARASGIHIVMATQRPSVDVITGVIKANFPTRISFAVTSKIDSRTILGEQGAEQLLGRGDMLYMAGGRSVVRVHGPFVKDEEVESVVNYLKQCAKPKYNAEITKDEEDPEEAQTDSEGGEDDLYAQAVNIIKRDGRVSISYVQRKLSVGYNKAAKLIERMEEEGIVSTPNHSGKRVILDQ